MFGADVGELNVKDERDTLIWGTQEQTIVDGDSAWLLQEVSLSTSQRLFVMELMRGGTSADEEKGDIAIDDIIIKTNGQCRQPAGK